MWKRNRENNERFEIVTFRVASHEHYELICKAMDAGLTKSEYIRELIKKDGK